MTPPPTGAAGIFESCRLKGPARRFSSSALTGRRAQAVGLSLVELLVGVAIGLFIVAVGMTLLTGNLRESRALIVENRLMQDLRTASDLIARDLRRAGYWQGAAAGVWQRGASGVQPNPYSAIAPAAGASDALSFRFSRGAGSTGTVDNSEQFGFRLRAGAVEMMLGNGNWQAVTDTGTLLVSGFSLTPAVQERSLSPYCSTPCGASGSDCPRQQVRSVALTMTARAVADTSVVRTVRHNVRLRNDSVNGACPA